MLTCYVIDDETIAIDIMVSYIKRIPYLQLLGATKIAQEALLEFEQKNSYPDITFLDIEMPDLNGMEVSTLLKDRTLIVLTTAHPGFAIEAFEKDITDYLLKPISFDRFLKCIKKIQDRLEEKNKKPDEEFFYIQTGSNRKQVKIKYEDILYIESDRNYVTIVTTQENHIIYFSLNELLEKLPAGFLRINKSFIANTGKIHHVEGNEVFFENGASYPIGTSYKEAFNQYVEGKLLKIKRS